MALLLVLALVASGCTTLGWGWNAFGQLGTGTGVDETTPVAGSLPDWREVEAGGSQTCAIAVDDSLWCWGWNYFGGVGDGTTNTRGRPVRVGTDTDWADLTVGFAHACATKGNGSLWCWGANAARQLGDYTTTDRWSPTQVLAGPNWTSVEAGFNTTCALNDNADLWCFGSNLSGQIDTTPSTSEDPTRLGNGWVDIAVSVGTICGVLGTNDLWCWGRDDAGELGDGAPANPAPTPKQVSPGTTWVSVDAGDYHLCAIETTGSLFRWGESTDGQVGDGTTGAIVWSPVAVASGTKWAEIDPGDLFTCGRQTDSTLWCWGSDSQQRLGNGTASGTVPIPAQLGSENDWEEVSTGGGQTCARREAAIWCWGSDSSKAGLDGTNQSEPMELDPDILDVTAGLHHSCRVAENGTLWCTGDNGAGQVGSVFVGSSTDTYRRVGLSTRWVAVDAGGDVTCGIEADDLFCWGANANGQLGDGTTTDRAAPALVALDVAQASTGGRHTCAVYESGALYCWGRNDRGQLGLGDTSTRLAPVQVGTDTDWQAVAAGFDFTCALKTDGSMHCFGANTFGQLGSGDTVDRSTPEEIVGTSWSVLDAGYGHVCATRADRTLFCWGDNTYGQLGDGTTTARTTPTLTGGSTPFIDIGTGDFHTCAVETGGPTNELYCFGGNFFGQLGDGTTTNRSTPTLIASGANWFKVAAGSAHTIGVTVN
ncbi:MAG: hypothetical protein AAF548_02785 [Actinomycetota bacterium]